MTGVSGPGVDFELLRPQRNTPGLGLWHCLLFIVRVLLENRAKHTTFSHSTTQHSQKTSSSHGFLHF